MADEPESPAPADSDAPERRQHRPFSLNEAIGRLGGGDFMKDGSPLTRKRQAELALDDFLRGHLVDKGGVLRNVLLRHLDESLLKADYDRPLAVLADYLTRVLASDALLTGLVRDADIDWGRSLGERPHFELPGQPAHPDDPYTAASVRTALARVLDGLRQP